ncbi:DUF624 domain-containing protein [Lapidilactobacillus bayanensis]|uniref:DUF624 domain-containing protein n=1 Tax=Lapidilactobacillus bayanensis TaxID=2485998 RepID=UPI000F76F706|nr:DUF624 domain-containing protein [Lapidilactobacillus bayanensis]
MKHNLFEVVINQINKASVDVIYKFYYSFIIDLCILLSNILLLGCALFVKLSFPTLIIYFIPIFLLGPSIATTLHSISQLNRQESASAVFKNFFNAYLSMLKNTWQLSLIYSFIMIIGLMDLQLIMKFAAVRSLMLPILITVIYLVASMFFAYRIKLLHQDWTIGQVMWDAVLYSYRNVGSTAIIGLILIVLGVITILSPAISVFILFGVSIVLIARIVDKKIFVSTSLMKEESK